MSAQWAAGGMKTRIGVLMLAIFLVFGVGQAREETQKTVAMQGSLLMHAGKTGFVAGTTDKTAIFPDDAAPLRLARSAGRYWAQGSYLSPIIKTAPFRSLVISWNADTPSGTEITIEAQVLADGKWSEWFSWGTWGDGAASADNPASSVAKMTIDTLVLQAGQRAVAIRLPG